MIWNKDASKYLINKSIHKNNSDECFDKSFRNYSMNTSFSKNSSLYETLWNITTLKPATRMSKGQISDTCIDASSLFNWNTYNKDALLDVVSISEQNLWNGIFEDEQYYYWSNHYDPLLFLWWVNSNTSTSLDNTLLQAGAGSYQKGWISRPNKSDPCTDYNYSTNNI